MTGIKGVPENITVMFLNPTSVRVSWSTSQVEKVEKYDVSYKPTDARCVPKIPVIYLSHDYKHSKCIHIHDKNHEKPVKEILRVKI